MATKASKGGDKKGTKVHLTDVQLGVLKKMGLEGVSPKLIAKELNVAISTVHYQKGVMKKAGVVFPSVQKGNPQTRKTTSGNPDKRNLTPPSPASGKPNSRNSTEKTTQPDQMIGLSQGGSGNCKIIINNTPIQMNKGFKVRIEGATNIDIANDGSWLISF